MYYLVFGFLYLFSLLPWWLMYLLSDGVYALLYYVIRYRRDIVAGNLHIAFPEKSEAERKQIAKEFYKGFVDNFIETVKLFSMSAEELNKRFTANYEVINTLHATGKNMQMHSGHFFNWEYANAAVAYNILYPLVIVYMPIDNKLFDRAFLYMRKRFGTKLVAATDFKNQFLPYTKSQYCIGLVGDQNPGGPDRAYWTKFFGKMTPIVKGPERNARISNTAVVMVNFYRVKRGYYNCEFEVMTTEPRELPHGEITRRMMQFVERAICEHPSCYLWSHRRWKWQFDEAKYGKMVV